MRFWRLAGVTFAILNVAGGIYAAATGEMMHAVTHFMLLAGTLALLQGRSGRKQGDVAIDARGGLDPQLQHLQQSLDSIALEVERIGESQRFINKLGQKPDPSTSPSSQIRPGT